MIQCTHPTAQWAQTVQTAQTAQTVQTVQTAQTVQTVQTAQTAQTVQTAQYELCVQTVHCTVCTLYSVSAEQCTVRPQPNPLFPMHCLTTNGLFLSYLDTQQKSQAVNMKRIPLLVTFPVKIELFLVTFCTFEI